MASDVIVNDESIEKDNSGEIKQESPSFRSKLWNKTPFSSFSSDSSIESSVIKEKHNLQSLRFQLQTYKFSEDLNIEEKFNFKPSSEGVSKKFSYKGK